MSRNPSRADRSEYRNTGRSGSSGHQRQFYGSGATKGGGGAPPTAVGNRSSKKYNISEGGQPGQKYASNVETGDSNPAPNGAHQRTTQTQRVSGAPAPIMSTAVEPSDTTSQKKTQVVPCAPHSGISASATNSESHVPKMPPKAPEDASKTFSLQFGSLSPSIVNKKQDEGTLHVSLPIPARTSSAPPDLDEQRKTQVRHGSLMAPPSLQTPTAPKVQLSKNDERAPDDPNSGQAPSVINSKRDGQVSAAQPVMHTQKQSLHPMPMQPPFHQQHVSVQFSGLHPQLQSQFGSGTSSPMPMPMPLPIGNPTVSHSMFVPGPQMMQTPGMMHHQGQPINFYSQMGHQLPPQIAQQSPLKFGGSSRRAVKITHPETHEELRLDSSPVPKPPTSVLLHSQSPHIPMNFYSNPYSGAPVFMNPSTQPPRSYNQVTIKPPVSSQVSKDMGPSISTSVGKIDPPKPPKLHGEDLSHPQKKVMPSSLSSTPESRSRVGATSESASSAAPINMDKNLTSVSASVDNSPSLSQSSPGEETVGVFATEPTVDKQKKSHSIAHQHQGGGLGVEVLDPKSISSGTNSVTEADKETLLPGDTASLEPSNSTSMGSEEGKADETSRRVEESSYHDAVLSAGGGLVEHSETEPDDSSSCRGNDIKMNDEAVSEQKSSSRNIESSGSTSSQLVQDDKVFDSVLSPRLLDNVDKGKTHSEPSLSNDDARHKNEGIENPVDIIVSSDANVVKTAAPRGEKMKELYRKAEAVGTSTDLYMAYMGPEDKKEIATSADVSDRSLSVNAKQKSVGETKEKSGEKPHLVKVEPDNWEDAAEISTPHLEPSMSRNLDTYEDTKGLTIKTYSRDFLLKFKDHCTDLPVGFEISANVADALMTSRGNAKSQPSPRRKIDKQTGGDEDKWIKFPGPLMTGRGDMRGDFGYSGHYSDLGGFPPGQGGNYGGAMRNRRAQMPLQYSGGILTGPMQSPSPQGGLMSNNSDSDRWQSGSGFMKGLMPSPQTPVPVMHRAERKYEIGKVTDEEEAKQRQLKAILNKLTPQNFEKLFQQVKEVNIDNVVTLSGVIAQIFDKALMEPTFCEMYADFCFRLASDLPNLSVGDEKITFKRLLLNKCQEEFERGEREEEEANKSEEDGENKQTAEEREEQRLKARRRMLGNIRLIGELYKKRMLTERIMHACINKLLYQNPDEENIEALCKLMSTIGEMIDHHKSKDHIDAYFDMMAQMSNNTNLSSRIRFMLKDSIDLRKNKWQQRRKVEGPKKIEDVHRDAAQERHAQAGRLARVPSMGSGSARRGDFVLRSPSILSPQGGSFRAPPPQLRDYGSEDIRMDDRQYSSDNRTVSLPLPQRAIGDETITLGPQGGLARGMAFRGQPLVANAPIAHMPGQNVFGSGPQRAVYGQRETDRFGAPYYDQSSHPNRNRDARNTDRGDNRSRPTTPSDRSGSGPLTGSQGVSSGNVWPEEVLREKSLSAIKEFYSARDENELALCIKEMNSPSFYPIMISIWVADSFERKGMERDLLTKLLINLTKPDLHMISKEQLIKGFESVLEILEDAVNDAPKAAEFLGQTFAKVIVENIASLAEIGRLIQEGGEERGRLVEIALGAEVLGSTLDMIKEEKGDDVLNEIISSSNLQLEDFRPPAGSNKTLRIDRFI